jgi:FixJ family two-component response regulator
MSSVGVTRMLGENRTNVTQAFGRQLGLPTIPNFTPIVFVVDEDSSVRASLELFIRSKGWQPETFATVREFLDHPRPPVSNCLILAISHKGINGIEVQQQMARERAEMPIIVTSSYEDTPTTVQFMKAGALDFLVKPCGHGALLAAIRQSLERSRVALDRESQLRNLHNCYASLTPRERQVMALVVSGLLNKQVGGELGISEFTVKAHRGQVMQKMKANSLADLVRFAAELRPALQAIHFARRQTLVVCRPVDA